MKKRTLGWILAIVGVIIFTTGLMITAGVLEVLAAYGTTALIVGFISLITNLLTSDNKNEKLW